MKRGGGRAATAKGTTRDFFTWTDDEVELLLKVTREYKAVHAAENRDWEAVQSKYGDIFERYRRRYPSPEEAKAAGMEYPHTKDELTKGQLTTKLKAIRIKYRQAVDSGRKSGHGRVVLLYFKLCASIWGGTRSNRAISEGIGVGGVVVEAVKSIASSPDTGSSSSSVPGGGGVAEDAVSAEMVANRHQRLDATLSGCRREKLKRKFSTDPVAQEDLDIKRRLLQRLEATDDEFVQTMGRWSSMMDRLNSNIELLVQHIVGSGTTHYMTPCLHTPRHSDTNHSEISNGVSDGEESNIAAQRVDARRTPASNGEEGSEAPRNTPVPPTHLINTDVKTEMELEILTIKEEQEEVGVDHKKGGMACENMGCSQTNVEPVNLDADAVLRTSR